MTGLEYVAIGFILGLATGRGRITRRWENWAARKGTEHADRLADWMRRRKENHSDD